MRLPTFIGRHSRSARLLGMGCAMLAAAALTAEAVAADVVSEAQVKAAFLYNFTRFVDWPAQAFAGPDEPLVIGVLEERAVTENLRTIVAGRRVNGRAIVVRDIETRDDAATAQVLFVGAAGEPHFGALHDALAGRAVLTVGESPAFASAGGTIVLVEHGGKLRFEINVAAAERAQVRVSAELKKLATAVRSAP